MDELSFEINKNKPVYEDDFKHYQENLLRNDKMDMIHNLERNKEDISDLGQDMENSFIEENSIKKKGKEAPSNGPKHIALERRFSYDRKDDNVGMKEVRRKLRYYLDSVEEEDTDKQAENLKRLIAECKNYCKGKFMIFKFGRAKERLREVKALKEEAERKLQALPQNKQGGANLELIHNDRSEMYVSNIGAVVVIGRFLVENLIRIPLTLLTLPVWAVNEGVRKIQKSRGKTQNRSIRLPWMHRWGYYVNQQLFKKKTIGFSTYRSFKERFIKHNTDLEAMDRADQDYYNATEGFDFSDDSEDDDEGSED